MIDHVFDRLTFSPHREIDASSPHHPNKLVPIPWSNDNRPNPNAVFSLTGSDPLPQVPVVLVTWTAAEWEAMCDVLTPGVSAQLGEREYRHGWYDFVEDLTPRSPAKFAQCLAKCRLVMGNGKLVLLMHSNLHISTDSANLPLTRLFDQIIEETQCDRIITTGTAGGIGSDKQLGDVVVGSACRFNCNKHLKNKPFNHQTFPTDLIHANIDTVAPLVAANFGQLADFNQNYLMIPGEIETTDFFAFDTSNDHFGLQKEDNKADAVEMDDAVLGYIISERKKAAKHVPEWGAVRNCSDPQADMNHYATFNDAERDMGRIYRRYGYWTTVPSVIESWLMGIV